MPSIFTTYKTLIDTFLLEFLESKRAELSQVNSWGPDMVDRIKESVVAGKTVRGALVLLAYSFTNEKPSQEAIAAAAVMELLQTALLIHDDIMDGDTVRRGKPTLHVQYKSESLAMCVGDALFFLAFELLGSIETDALTLGRIIRLVGREYQAVCIAQMADVAKTPKTKEETLALYTYKTARYTFAVPLMIGATIAGTTKEMLKYLESYGVAVGVLFQIQDDVLDNEKNPFTPADIEGYKTAAHESLSRLTIEEKQKTTLGDLLDFVLTRKN